MSDIDLYKKENKELKRQLNRKGYAISALQKRVLELQDIVVDYYDENEKLKEQIKALEEELKRYGKV